MTLFAGFPSGKNPYVPVPEVFFTELLPEIEDTAELKVTLHLFWLLARKQGDPRCVNERELVAASMLNIEQEQLEQINDRSRIADILTTAHTYDTPQHIQVQIERPNIFVLYEQNIGLLSPLLADELKDAADQYPGEWIEAAF